MKARWADTIIADSDATILIEGNHYFPPDSVNMACLRKSETHTTCSWKGIADYYDIVIDDKINADAAWLYPQPKQAAEEIAGYFSFWNGVEMTE